MMADTALLIVDAQVNMFDETFGLYRATEILDNIGILIERARRANAPIVYIQNCGGPGDPDQPGTPGWEIHPAFTPRAGDGVVQKHTPDAFCETELQRQLDARGIRQLVVAGMQTEMCIDATCRRAADLGYEVTLVEDAHSTFDSETLSAPQLVAHHNDTLRSVARLRPTNDIRF